MDQSYKFFVLSFLLRATCFETPLQKLLKNLQRNWQKIFKTHCPSLPWVCLVFQNSCTKILGNSNHMQYIYTKTQTKLNKAQCIYISSLEIFIWLIKFNSIVCNIWSPCLSTKAKNTLLCRRLMEWSHAPWISWAYHPTGIVLYHELHL